MLQEMCLSILLRKYTDKRSDGKTCTLCLVECIEDINISGSVPGRHISLVAAYINHSLLNSLCCFLSLFLKIPFKIILSDSFRSDMHKNSLFYFY